MFRKQIVLYFLVILFISCVTDSGTKIEPGAKTVDKDFTQFVEVFSRDSQFQITRIDFPLKTKINDLDSGRDKTIFIQRAAFETIDLSKKRSTGTYDRWERNIVVDKDHKIARVEIRGIDNGIWVDYVFENKKGQWILIEIDDSST